MKTAEARAYLWQQGIIAPWYLKPYQMDGYELMLNNRFPFVEMSRRIGKTTTALVHTIESLRQGEEKIWRWCEPWKYQAREIVIPEMSVLQESCPEKYKFKYFKTDSFFECAHNGARLYLRGVNEDRGESSRGAFSHGITADELGSWREANYILDEVLLPQLLSTNGQLIRISTPPRNLGHLYYEDRDRAMREGRFVQKTIWAAEGTLYSKEQILAIRDAVGGENSPAWRREFLCEAVADPEMLIVPEFHDVENVVPNDYERPAFFHPYVAGDSGFDDNTAIVFGYYDFLKDEDVIEDEIVIRGKTTAEIVQLAKAKEAELWGTIIPKRRAYDASKQQIFDIFVDHKWPVSVPPKDDKHAAIHEMRVRVGARKVKIKERCHQTRRQLKVGMWKDERHSDFERSDGLGHLDAIAATVYFSRIIDRKLNPYPAHLGASPYTHHIPSSRPAQDQTEAALSKLFGGSSRGRR